MGPGGLKLVGPSHSLNRSTNQAIKQASNQSINQASNQPTNQSVNLSIYRTIYLSILYLPTNLPTYPAIHPPRHPSIIIHLYTYLDITYRKIQSRAYPHASSFWCAKILANYTKVPRKHTINHRKFLEPLEIALQSPTAMKTGTSGPSTPPLQPRMWPSSPASSIPACPEKLQNIWDTAEWKHPKWSQVDSMGLEVGCHGFPIFWDRHF